MISESHWMGGVMMEPRTLFIVAMRIMGLYLLMSAVLAVVMDVPDFIDTFERAPYVGWEKFWNVYARPVSAGVVGWYFLFAGGWLIDRVQIPSRAAEGQCSNCGYDIRSCSDACPECGTPVASQQKPADRA